MGQCGAKGVSPSIVKHDDTTTVDPSGPTAATNHSPNSRPGSATATPPSPSPKRIFKWPFPTPSLAKLLDKRFGYPEDFTAKFKLGKEVGRGHFGHTFWAKGKKGDLKNQQVAVKIISKAKMTSAILIEDVHREVKILKILSGHPNLVKFYDAFEDPRNVYIVMEGGRYAEDDAKAIVVQILKAVAFCHLHGVIHRDLNLEVMQIVKKSENLKKISFLAHSLGGLFARHAVAVLYSPNTSRSDHSDEAEVSTIRNSVSRGTIAGLEPINFITLATPHLGVRGKKQLPFLLGVPFLEKLAAPMAPLFVGRTGSQLFLTDGKPNKPPLLLRMASDCEDGKFISALAAFKCRVLYANVSYDHMVGWRTSSIRRETELVKPPLRSLDGYKHVVDVEYCPPVSSDGPHFPPEAAKAKEAAQNSATTQNTLEYHEIMEEEMIRGLQQLGWKKVDVSFHSSFWPFFAHNNIHVKNEWFHNAGAGVIAHVADSLKQQEKQQEISSMIAASL